MFFWGKMQIGFLVMNEKRLPKTTFRTVFFPFFFFEEATAERFWDLKQPSRFFSEFRIQRRDPYSFSTPGDFEVPDNVCLTYPPVL